MIRILMQQIRQFSTSMIARYLLLALQPFRGNQHVIHCRAKCRYFATSRYHSRLTQLPTLRSDPSFAFVVSPQYKSTAILETMGETKGAIGTSRAHLTLVLLTISITFKGNVKLRFQLLFILKILLFCK